MFSIAPKRSAPRCSFGGAARAAERTSSEAVLRYRTGRSTKSTSLCVRSDSLPSVHVGSFLGALINFAHLFPVDFLSLVANYPKLHRLSKITCPNLLKYILRNNYYIGRHWSSVCACDSTQPPR